MAKDAVAAVVEPLVLDGSLVTCTVTDLEQLFSARSAAEHREWREDIALRFHQVAIDQHVLDRAVEVQGLLADRGQHRGANIIDLIVAATAERAGLIVLHYDSDFDLIATVTSQPVEWVVPRGSVD
ncbi:MAG: PIN domain-containing protein [Solirubrobacteraceae bacterium]